MVWPVGFGKTAGIWGFSCLSDYSNVLYKCIDSNTLPVPVNLVINTETQWGCLIWHESLTKTWGGTAYKIWRCRALVWLKGDGAGEQAWGHGWSVANTGMIPVGCRLAMGTWHWTWWQHRRSPNTGGIDEMSGVTGGRIQKEWTSQFWVQHCAKLPVTEYSRLQWGITWLTTWT